MMKPIIFIFFVLSCSNLWPSKDCQSEYNKCRCPTLLNAQHDRYCEDQNEIYFRKNCVYIFDKNDCNITNPKVVYRENYFYVILKDKEVELLNACKKILESCQDK